MENKDSEIQDEVPKVLVDDDGSSKKLDPVKKDISNTVVDGSSKNLDLLKDSSNSVVDGNSEDIAVKPAEGSSKEDLDKTAEKSSKNLNDELAKKSYEIFQGIDKKACGGEDSKLKKRLVDLFNNKPASSVNDDEEVNKACDIIDEFLEEDNLLAAVIRKMETDVGAGMLLAQKELGAVIKNDEEEKKAKKQKTTK
ncbi:hypothetical protein MtrunA17_Chr5g0411281 [Medicago truncatula]|uniref:Uncharacterized protein n=1 Tax=Medicago truncatula TaxID=3880 RepID=A0A396HQU2_MEDTR|nr:uncharacterized protein LOC120580611 [Medicago truncatula]RHN54843.1 hypothetical protein MtrunA17_Chr5g0411281 [Medicago truncatula]